VQKGGYHACVVYLNFIINNTPTGISVAFSSRNQHTFHPLESVVATSSTFRLEANVVDSSFVLSPFHSSPDVNKVHIKLFTEI